MKDLPKLVHICDTVDEWGIYVSLKAFGIAKGMRPFLLCAKGNGMVFKVFLNRYDREDAIAVWEFCSPGGKLNLLGEYRKLRLATLIYTEQGWKKVN